MTRERYLVTGAGSGVGRAIVDHLGPKAVTMHHADADVCDYEAVKRYFAAVGPLSGVAHCAGVAHPGGLHSSTSDFKSMMDVNVLGTFHVARAFVENNPSGTIVLLASRAGLGPRPKWLGYGASKAAVISMAASLSVELAPDYRIHCLAPGPIDTPMRRSLVTSEYADLLDPVDVARRVTELLQSPFGSDGHPIVMAR